MTSSTHWDILSSWSKAGIGTSIVLELKKKPITTIINDKNKNNQSSKKSSPRIAFDMGSTPCFDDAIPAKYVFVSHGHVDHVGGLFSHARAHAVTRGGAAPTYFIPAQLLPQIEQCRDAMSLLDACNMHDHEGGDESEQVVGRNKSLINMKLVPVHPGDEFELKGISCGTKTSFFMRAYKVDHAGHPALGYTICSRTITGLKDEYKTLDNASLRHLIKSGVSVKADPIETIEIGYSGDTCARGLMKQSEIEKELEQKPSFGIDQLFQAELLLCELTFLDSSDDEQQRSKAAERGHLHITDIENIFASYNLLEEEEEEVAPTTRPSDGEDCAELTTDTTQYPKNIVFYHLSAKYSPARKALDLIAEGLPQQLYSRSQIAISSMLTREEKSSDDVLMRLIQSNGCISLAEYISHQRDSSA